MPYGRSSKSVLSDSRAFARQRKHGVKHFRALTPGLGNSVAASKVGSESPAATGEGTIAVTGHR
jgi:hypothetical protein